MTDTTDNLGEMTVEGKGVILRYKVRFTKNIMGQEIILMQYPLNKAARERRDRNPDMNYIVIERDDGDNKNEPNPEWLEEYNEIKARP